MNNEIKAKIKETQDKIKAAQKELQEYSAEQFKVVCADLFTENPELKSFKFRGYRLYFNDGDDLTYSVYTDAESIDINGENGSDISSAEYYLKEKSQYEITPKELKQYQKLAPLAAIQEKVGEVLSSFEDSFYKEAFGEHFEATVTEKKVTIEEYTDHD